MIHAIWNSLSVPDKLTIVSPHDPTIMILIFLQLIENLYLH